MYAMEISSAVAHAQRADRLLGAALMRAARADAAPVAAAPAPREPAEVVIRLARESDRGDLDGLRQLEGRGRGWARDDWAGNGPWAPEREVLVALVDGALVAGLLLDDPEDVVADPFRRTEAVVGLLQARARQVMRPVKRPRRFRHAAAHPVRAR